MKLTTAAASMILALGLTACGTTTTIHVPGPVMTKTVKIPAPTITKLKTVTHTVTVPGPTVTITADTGSSLPCYVAVDNGVDLRPSLMPASTVDANIALSCSASVSLIPPKALGEENLTISSPGYGSSTYIIGA